VVKLEASGARRAVGGWPRFTWLSAAHHVQRFMGDGIEWQRPIISCHLGTTSIIDSDPQLPTSVVGHPLYFRCTRYFASMSSFEP